MTKTIEWLTRWHSTTFNSTFRHYDRPKPQKFRKTTEMAIAIYDIALCII